MNIDHRLDGPVEAPLLVLSNPLGTTLDLWQPLMAELTRHFRVLRYNARGHGATPLPASALTLERLGLDVIDLLDKLQVEQALFCGVSLGGLTGLWLSRFYPQRFQRMVVANTAARIGTQQNWLNRAAQIRRDGLSTVAATCSSRWFTPAFVRAAHPQVTRLVMQLANADPAGYAACCDVLAAADLRAEVRRMTVPLLVIAGDEDPVTTVEDARWLTSHIAAASLARLPASHLSCIACPQAFSEAVSEFLLRRARG
ncbi:3-oxoadipate enol-lactonase [Erwinia persicina]|uniref:3-oxoadipate enol-lactonase n=1 Tax=Erwinia persicina TaxID=55211 RepID=UPI001785B609|nr:3-oxoadipate enol-lactonase [Erwinia persicina]MBD8164617.1 3-oxoadipate enol-lactonase [Erwinia persicina]